MDWANVIIVALTVSVDAMTVCATDSIVEKKMKIAKLAFIALTFGVFQFLMPYIGYLVGYSFQQELEAYIPWIAFALLTLLGIKSIIDWAKEFQEDNKQRKMEKLRESGAQNPFIVGARVTLVEEREDEKKLTIPTILVQGVATSIDALCIGFVYLDYTMDNALIAFATIGASTFTLSFLAGLLGTKVAKKLERWATLIAGLVFVAIALKILIESYIG